MKRKSEKTEGGIGNLPLMAYGWGYRSTVYTGFTIPPDHINNYYERNVQHKCSYTDSLDLNLQTTKYCTRAVPKKKSYKYVIHAEKGKPVISPHSEKLSNCAFITAIITNKYVVRKMHLLGQLPSMYLPVFNRN